MNDENLLAAHRALAEAMDGGFAVEFDHANNVLQRPEVRDTSRGGHPDAVAIVRTSGSTGTPKQTVLTTAGLTASAKATEEFLGGAGQWLVGLGLHYVAGLAMVSRSIVAGAVPVAMEPGSFTTELFIASAKKLTHDFRAVSLVPTQVARIFDADQPDSIRQAGINALKSFDAVLIGGARMPARLREQVDEAQINTFTTYGMSETCGGCVYNGHTLPGVELDTVESSAGSRIRITGPVVAAGYFDRPELTFQHFGTHSADSPLAGRRWYLTDDLGAVTTTDTGQNLELFGRVDDVINTGGVKVSAQRIQSALESHPSIREAFVTGIDDPQWGQRVCAALVPTSPIPKAAVTDSLLDELRTHVRSRLGPAAVPKSWNLLSTLPLLPNGKTDRARLKATFEESL